MKFIISGPESSGKTTLCKKLSKYLNTNFIHEYARLFLSNINQPYSEADLLIIAEKQYELEEKNKNIFLLDTDLITIKIWSDYKYGRSDPWILKILEKQQTEERFYLICKPDIPWKADPLRENPYDREKIFKLFHTEIQKLGHQYTIIEGENRFNNAISKIIK